MATWEWAGGTGILHLVFHDKEIEKKTDTMMAALHC